MDMEEVYRGPDDEKVLLLRGWLESHGVKCIAGSDVVHSVHPLSVDGLGEVRIEVAADDAERARHLVEEFRKRGTAGRS